MSRRREIGVILLLASVAVWWGTWYSAESTRRGERFALYDFAYGPAVMVACGRGYINPSLTDLPQLSDFLRTRTDHFECASLPARVSEEPLIGFQRTFRFLMLTMAAVWKIGGISWSMLSYLSGVLFAVTIVLVYLTVKLVAPWWLAAGAALFTMTSPLQLAYLSDFRNYPKAPLAIALGYVLGLLARGGSMRRVIATGVLFGVLLGFGLGFRQDLLIYLPVFIAVVALRVEAPGRALRIKALTIATTAVAFIIALGPQLSAYAPGGGASVQHVATLGLMSPFDAPLGVTSDQLYEWGYYNEDSFAAATIAGHGHRFLGMNDAITVYDRAYDRAATSYWTELMRTFPADLVTRGYASVLRLIELPSSTSYAQVPSLVHGRWFEPIWTLRASILSATTGLWAALTVTAILIAGAASFRVGLALGLLIIYMLAYPAVQFHERHFFFLDIIPITAATFALVQLVQWRARRAEPARRSGRRALAVAVTLAVIVIVPLITARAVQAQTVHALLQGYADAPSDAVELIDHPLPGGGVAVDLAPTDQAEGVLPADQTKTELYAIALGGSSCDRLTVDLTLRYRTSHANPNFTYTRLVAIGRAPETTRVFLPAFTYRSGDRPGEGVVWYRPGSIEVAAGQRSCLTAVSRVRGIESMPMMVTAVLPPGWERETPFQTLSDVERRPRVVPILRTDPGALAIAGTVVDSNAIKSFSRPTDAADIADVVQTADGRWIVSGRGGLGGRGRMFYLAQFRNTPLKAKQFIVAEGTLTQGGLSLGLVRNGSWAAQVQLTEPGPFMIMIEAPESATYDVILANNLAGRFQSNDFVLTRFGMQP